MAVGDYERVIREFCLEVGIPDWARVIATGHIEASGFVIGLLHDETAVPDVLFLYFDLGSSPSLQDCERLLQANTQLQAGPDAGYFGLHPEQGSVVFRVNITLDSGLSGADLAQAIERSRESGIRRLKEAFEAH